MYPNPNIQKKYFDWLRLSIHKIHAAEMEEENLIPHLAGLDDDELVTLDNDITADIEDLMEDLPSHLPGRGNAVGKDGVSQQHSESQQGVEGEEV